MRNVYLALTKGLRFCVNHVKTKSKGPFGDSRITRRNVSRDVQNQKRKQTSRFPTRTSNLILQTNRFQTSDCIQLNENQLTKTKGKKCFKQKIQF